MCHPLLPQGIYFPQRMANAHDRHPSDVANVVDAVARWLPHVLGAGREPYGLRHSAPGPDDPTRRAAGHAALPQWADSASAIVRLHLHRCRCLNVFMFYFVYYSMRPPHLPCVGVILPAACRCCCCLSCLSTSTTSMLLLLSLSIWLFPLCVVAVD